MAIYKLARESTHLRQLALGLLNDGRVVYFEYVTIKHMKMQRARLKAASAMDPFEFFYPDIAHPLNVHRAVYFCRLVAGYQTGAGERDVFTMRKEWHKIGQPIAGSD